MGNFVLDGGAGAVPMSIEVEGAETNILTVTAHMSDGSVIKNAAATYTSLTPGVSVSSTGRISWDNPEVTSADVKAEFEVLGISVSKTVTGIKPVEISGKRFVYDIASRMSNTKVLFTDLTYPSNNNMWAYAANRRNKYSWQSGGVNESSPSGKHLVYTANKGISIRALRKSNWWAIKINVPDSGLYLPTVSYGTYKNNSTYSLK